MAKIITRPKLTLELTFTISEAEARALDGLTGYNMDDFLKCFYTHMGKHYLEPHEDGLREFFESIRQIVKPELDRIDATRRHLNPPPTNQMNERILRCNARSESVKKQSMKSTVKQVSRSSENSKSDSL